MPALQNKKKQTLTGKSICPHQNPVTTTVDTEKSNIAEAHDKDFKIVVQNMSKDLKEDMDKSLKEICENTK